MYVSRVEYVETIKISIFMSLEKCCTVLELLNQNAKINHLFFYAWLLYPDINFSLSSLPSLVKQ